MTTGLSTANLANKWLDMLRGTAFTAPSGVWVKLHTGDPGSAGTANASAVTTRNQLTFNAASNGNMNLASSGLADYSMTGTETISHTSVWDASTNGNFLFSAALTLGKSVINGDTLHVVTYTLTTSPLAA